MRLEPSEAETSSWRSLADVMAWAGIRRPSGAPAGAEGDALSPRGTALQHVGLEAEDSPNVVGALDEATWMAGLDGWAYAGRPAPLGALAKMGLVGMGCRIYAGTQERRAARRERERREARWARGPKREVPGARR